MKSLSGTIAAVCLIVGVCGAVAQGAPTGEAQIPKNAVRLSYVNDTSEGMRSLAASGHAVAFLRPAQHHFVEAVQIFAGRYGMPEPPDEDFHVYLLNDKFQVLRDFPIPYGKVERADLRWYSFATSSTEVPERFYVALSFNPHQTKGIYLGFDKDVQESHSLVGLPDSGFEPVKETYDWMVRLYLTEQPSNPQGVQRLADWKPPQVVDPFQGCIEAKFDTGKSEGMQSYGSRGPAIRLRFADFLPKDTPARNAKLVGLRFYAGRYGSGYDTRETVVRVSLLDAQGKVLLQNAFPYSLFSYKEKWVDLPFPKPIPLDAFGLDQGEVTIAFDAQATQYKGIYFHYNKDPKISHSLAGTVARGFQPLADREWMIRAYLAQE